MIWSVNPYNLNYWYQPHVLDFTAAPNQRNLNTRQRAAGRQSLCQAQRGFRERDNV